MHLDEAAREMTRHLAAAEALAERGEAALTGGALHLAIVKALRLAVTSAGTPSEHATALAALRGVVAGLHDPLCRAHVAALIEAALAAGGMLRLGAGLPPHDGRLGGWMDGLDGSGPVGAAARRGSARSRRRTSCATGRRPRPRTSMSS